ncbi:hypothetical protein [Limimaricola sp.]|uniref:hypothetical protein n=1 Tax=Limimaricola sp. TaxID=2211665 RepID=UPI0040583093
MTKQDRLLFESLAFLLETPHDNTELRMRHCREAAGIFRQMISRAEHAEAPDTGPERKEPEAR